MVLPGPREYWNKFRARSTNTPDIRDATLSEFVRSELTQEERIQLRLQPFDESARERLKDEYFKRHPDELQRLRRNDRRKELLAPARMNKAAPIAE